MNSIFSKLHDQYLTCLNISKSNNPFIIGSVNETTTILYSTPYQIFNNHRMIKNTYTYSNNSIIYTYCCGGFDGSKISFYMTNGTNLHVYNGSYIDGDKNISNITTVFYSLNSGNNFIMDCSTNGVYYAYSSNNNLYLFDSTLTFNKILSNTYCVGLNVENTTTGYVITTVINLNTLYCNVSGTIYNIVLNTIPATNYSSTLIISDFIYWYGVNNDIIVKVNVTNNSVEYKQLNIVGCNLMSVNVNSNDINKLFVSSDSADCIGYYYYINGNNINSIESLTSYNINYLKSSCDLNILIMNINNIGYVTNNSPTCIVENTQLEIIRNGNRMFVNIQNINKKDYVKTHVGWKKIYYIGYGKLYKNEYSVIYKMKNKEIYLTAGHSILMKDLKTMNNNYNSKEYNIDKIDNYYKIKASDCTLFTNDLHFEKDYLLYYHIVIQDNNTEKQFGLYIDDILVETMSINYIKCSKLNEIIDTETQQ